MKPLSVLAVTNAYPSAGDPVTGAFIKAQVDSLRAIGVQADIYHLNRQAQGRSIYRRLLGKLERRTEGKKYDLVHVMYGGVMAERATRLSSLPVVVSFCGSDLNGVPVGPPLARLSAAYGVRASRQAARRAASVIVKTKGLAERLPSGIDPARVHIIPNGVDLELFRHLDRAECLRTLGWSDDTRYVLFYGHEAGKRRDLAEAAVDRARAALAPLPVVIKTLGGVSHDDVPVWINACHALLCTSVAEGSPNVVKEALACDIPVVSTDVGDVRERTGSVDGCHIVAPDPRAISDALVQVLSSDGRVRGHETVLDLSQDATARRVLAVYESVLR